MKVKAVDRSSRESWIRKSDLARWARRKETIEKFEKMRNEHK